MAVPLFNSWAAELNIPYECPLQQLVPDGCVGSPTIGIEAGHFLEQMRQPNKEPLVPALGGYPLALEAFVMKQVKPLKDMGLTLYFYFDGLETSFDGVPLKASVITAAAISEAFDVYDEGNATSAIDIFRQADAPTQPTLFAYLRMILKKHDIHCVTAPFRAIPQMIQHIKSQYIHALFASPEAFLYATEPIITKFTLTFDNTIKNEGGKQVTVQGPLNIANSQYTYIAYDRVHEAVDNISHEALKDALLLAGTSYLETFPPLLQAQPAPMTFRAVLGLLKTYQYDIRRVMDAYPHEQYGDWFARYKKVLVALLHMPFLKTMTQVIPISATEKPSVPVPRDLHELVGLNLPAEAIYYMYTGLLSPRVLNWLIMGSIKLPAPLLGGDAPQVKKLIKDTLKPLRQKALALLGYSVNRWFLTREIVTTVYFDDTKDKTLIRDLSSDKDVVNTWRVKEQTINKKTASMQTVGTLFFALQSLTDSGFAKSTISSKQASGTLDTQNEIVANVIWRFLYLRDYVDNKHQLTKWGELMRRVLGKLGSDASKEISEAAFVTVELIRLQCLNTEALVPSENDDGKDFDKLNARLFSRLATTGKMHHTSKGYSGPLDRPLLAFHSMVSELRRTLRDMVEMAAAVLFLDNHGKRQRDDYATMAEKLPFQEDWSDGLGIIVKNYLDTAPPVGDKKLQEACMAKTDSYFMHADVPASYKDAFQLWTAVAEGVKGSDSLIDAKTKEKWEKANGWVSARSANFLS